MDWAALILYIAVAWIVIGLIVAFGFGTLARRSDGVDEDTVVREPGASPSAGRSPNLVRTEYIPSRSEHGNP